MARGKGNLVSVSDLRANLPGYLNEVIAGREIRVMRRGRVVARIVAPTNHRKEAKRSLSKLRKTAIVRDVELPIQADWDAAT